MPLLFGVVACTSSASPTGETPSTGGVTSVGGGAGAPMGTAGGGTTATGGTAGGAGAFQAGASGTANGGAGPAGGIGGMGGMAAALLLGMKGSTTYHFRIVANAGAAVSQDYTIQTGSVPSNVASLTFSSQAGAERGFLILGSWQNSKTAFIIDADGDIVCWHDSPAANIGRARMSADGKNMSMVAASNTGNPLYRISMDGINKQTYSGLQADHDITAVTGDTMAYLDFGGTCDRIFEITPAGNPRMVFDSTSHISSNVGPFGCHGNSLRYSAKEDVYVFSEHQQDVLVVNRNGSLAWRLTDTVGANSMWGGEQHGTHLLDDTLLVFANRGAGATSAVVEFSRTNWSVVNTFNTGLSTPNMGDVQRLPGGNTLITYSNSGERRCTVRRATLACE